MAKSIRVLLIISYLVLQFASSEDAKEVSFIENLDVKYENSVWTCGGERCLSGTTGCKIKFSSSKSKTEVYKSITCVGYKRHHDIIKLPTERFIDIDLVFFSNLNRQYFVDYGIGGSEVAKGQVNVKDLQNLKNEFIKKKQKAYK